MTSRIVITNIIIIFCALISGAQTLTGRYVELADSADMLMKREQWAAAENTIIRALRYEPANKSNYLLWSNLGVVRTQLQEFNKALEAFDIGLASAPRSTMLLTNRARTLLMMNRPEEAMKDLNSALDIDSLLSWPRKMRALINMQNKRFGLAEQDLTSLRALTPDDGEVLSALADIKVAKEEIEDALNLYAQSLSKEENEDVLFNYLLLMTESGNGMEARRLTSEALKTNATDWKLHALRALQYKQDYQTDLYAKERQKAMETGADINILNQILGVKK